ncbi:MAG TPA: tripartite tricarboxylate transporter substrate-binding protein [Candidatus Binatia bacterium]|jgi:tripartite-type tricarboxylate transporter receptor subunit TctC
MRRKLFGPALAIIVWLAPSAGAAQTSVQDAFKGKTVRMIVGLAPGGGYDTYTRLVARHFGKHIPGNPTVMVENMDGAGSLIAANHIFKVAKPDGLTIGHIVGGLFLQQLLGRPGIEFDAVKFQFIGVPTQDNFVLGVSKATGVTNLEKWIASKTVIKFGGVTPGGGTDDIPKVLAHTLGLPLQVVTGYKGTGPIRLAFNSGEVHGISNAWESLKATWRQELDSGELVVVVQATVKAHPDLPKVPVASNLAKNEGDAKLIQLIARVNGPTTRPYMLPPGTPKEIVETLRKAFIETMRDPDLLAEAQKAKLDIIPDDGASLERNVREIFKLDPPLVAQLKEILK